MRLNFNPQIQGGDGRSVNQYLGFVNNSLKVIHYWTLFKWSNFFSFFLFSMFVFDLSVFFRKLFRKKDIMTRSLTSAQRHSVSFVCTVYYR